MRRSCLNCEYFDKEHCTNLSMLQQELEQTCFNIQTEVAYQHMLQDNLSAPSGTYLYGGWMPVPQVCCAGGPEKTNCKNCGASMRGHYRCEYCGTVNN